MADRQGRIEVSAQVDQSLQTALANMGSSIRNVLEVTHSLSRAGLNNVNTAQALSKALNTATTASSAYARSTHNLARNQATLSKYFTDSKNAAAALERQMRANTTASAQEKAAVDRLVTSLKAQESARKGIMAFSAQSDLRRQSDALNQLSTRYSMAGNRMSMALTLPIASFMRSSFANYRRVETETIRTTKLISDSYTAAADVAGIAGAKLAADQLSYTKVVNGTIKTLKTLEGAQRDLGKELDKISLTYGVARELAQGLAGDFAELGIEEVETLAGLTDLTAAVEKLGNLDIGASQEFIKSIFQTVLRIKRDRNEVQKTADGFIVYGDVVGEVRQQLALFNLIENKTQMSLKDIAKGFPEVTAAATSFGLSMTEATALVVPMVSAGMQVGASSNSVKVSLQRVVDLTKENSQMIDTLKNSYAGFNVEAGVGVETIQALADSYNSMKRGALAEQGTLEFFSRLFGVRQGPRMEVAIQNLAQFQEQLDRLNTTENMLAKKLEGAVQQYATFEGLGKQYAGMSVKKFEDLSQVVRLSQSKDQKVAKAFTAARNDLAQFVSDEAKKGNDVLSKITTESGKALFIGAIGNVEGQRKFKQEVEASLQSVEVRYQRGREAIKSIGRQIVPILGQILEAVLPILMKINDAFEKMPSWIKSFLGLGLVMLAAIGPVMKLVGGMFQLKSALLGIKASGGFFGKMKSQTQEISAELLTASDAAFRFKNKLTEVGGKFFLQGTRKEIKELEKLINLQATGVTGKRVDRLQRKLGISKRTADYSGVSAATEASARGSFDPSYFGYRQPSFKDPNFPVSMMNAQMAGEKIGEAFLGILRAYGFDLSQVKSAVKTATTAATTVSTAGMRVVGGQPPPPPTPPTPPSTPPPTPPAGPSGGSPSGGRPSGPTPAPAPSPAPTPTTSNPMPVTVVNPSGGTPAHPVPPTTVPVNIRPTTLPMVDPTIINPNIPTPASALPQPLVPAMKEIVTPNFLTGGVEQVYGSIEAIATYTKKELLAMAKTLGIKNVSKLKVEDLRQAVIKAIMAPKEAVKEATEKVASNTRKATKATQSTAPPVDEGKVRRVKRLDDIKVTSDAGTDAVATSQGKKLKKTVEAVNDKVVSSLQPLQKMPGAALEGISPKAQKFASTAYQMMMNASISVGKPIDDIIDSLNLVGQGSRKVPFIFTKEKFLQLAQVLGIQLPPIFNKMGQLVDANGQALGVTRESLIKLINSMTQIGKAPAVLGSIAGQNVLQFEADVNQALALGKGSRKRFNFKGITGKLQDAMSRAFTTATGDIFADVAGKVASATGAQSGAIDYTKVTYADLDKKQGMRTRGDKRAKDRKFLKANQDLVNLAGRLSAEGLAVPTDPIDERSLTLSTLRSVKQLLAGYEDNRALRAVRRRELSPTAGYERVLKGPKPLDLMSEGEYKTFAETRSAGIKYAIDYREAQKQLIKGLSDNLKLPIDVVQKVVQSINEQTGELGSLEGLDRKTQTQVKKAFKSIKDFLQKSNDVTKGLSTPPPALTTRDLRIPAYTYERLKDTGLVATVTDQQLGSSADQATANKIADQATNKDNTVSKGIINEFGKVIYNLDARLAKRVKDRQAELEKVFGENIPQGAATEGLKAALVSISKEISRVATNQISGILNEITRIEAAINVGPKAKIEEAQARIQKANDAIAKINTVKVKSTEGQEILQGKTKKAYIEEQNAYIQQQKAIIQTNEIAVKAHLEQIKARNELIQKIEQEVEVQRQLLKVRAQELGVNPRLATGSVQPYIKPKDVIIKSTKTIDAGYKQEDADKRVDATAKEIKNTVNNIVREAVVDPTKELVATLQSELQQLKQVQSALEVVETGPRKSKEGQALYKQSKKIVKTFFEIPKEIPEKLTPFFAQIEQQIAQTKNAIFNASMASVPDISPSLRPKSLSAAVPDGATLLGQLNAQLASTLQIPTNVLDQFVQTLKIQGKGLAEIAMQPGNMAVDDLELLKRELANIGLTIEKAIATPAEALKQLQAVKFATAGPVQEMFQRLIMFARDVATMGVQDAFNLTEERLTKARAKAAGSAAGSKPKVTTPKVAGIEGFPIAFADLDKQGDNAYLQMQQLATFIKQYGITLEQLKTLGVRQLQYLADAVVRETPVKDLAGAKTARENPIVKRKLVATKDQAIASIMNSIGQEVKTVVSETAATPSPRPARPAKPAVAPAPAPAEPTISKDFVIGGLKPVQLQNFVSLATSVSEKSSGYASAIGRLIKAAGLEGEEVSVALKKIFESFSIYLKKFGLTADQLNQADALLRAMALPNAKPIAVQASKAYEAARGATPVTPTPPIAPPVTPAKTARPSVQDFFNTKLLQGVLNDGVPKTDIMRALIELKQKAELTIDQLKTKTNGNLSDTLAIYKVILQDAELANLFLKRYGIDLNQSLLNVRQAIKQKRDEAIASVRTTASSVAATPVAPFTPPSGIIIPNKSYIPSPSVVGPSLPVSRQIIIPNRPLIPAPSGVGPSSPIFPQVIRPQTQVIPSPTNAGPSSPISPLSGLVIPQNQIIPPVQVKTSDLIKQFAPKIDFKQIASTFIADLSPMVGYAKWAGTSVRNELVKSFTSIVDAAKSSKAPGFMARAVRAAFNPLKLVEKSLGGFGTVFGNVFSPSRLEYLARALGGTAPLMKYRKTDPLTGQAMPPIEGFVNNLKAVVPRALMGVGSAIQKTNLFPNLKALLQTTYAPYLPTSMAMGSGRGGKTRLTESGQRRTGMGGILDTNLARAGIAPQRQVTAQAQQLAQQLFKNITPSGFETMANSTVQSILSFTNKLLNGTVKVNNVLDATGRAVFQGLKEMASLTARGSVGAIKLMGGFYLELGIATKDAVNSLLGNVKSALNLVDIIANNTGNQKIKKFADNLRTGATRGAQLGSLQKDASAIDLANLTVRQKLGALAGIITVAGAQFGVSATKVSMQITGAMLQMTLKFVPFGTTIYKVGSSVVTLGSSLGKMAGAAKQASASADGFAGKMLAVSKAATTGMMGIASKGADKAKTMLFGAPAGPNGEPGKKGLVGGVMGGLKGFAGGAKSTVMGGMGTAVSMLSYQFGMVGMIAGPILNNIIQKIAMIPVVGGPVILLLAALVGAFFLLKKSTSAWAQYSDNAIAKFKMAWVKVKEIFGALLAPVMDFFASFLGETEGSAKGAENLGNKIGQFADKVLEVLPKIQEFVKNYIVPVLRQIMSGIKPIIEAIVPAVKFVINIVKAVVSLFKGDFSNAGKALKDAFGNAKDVIVKVLKGIVIILAPILKIIVTLFFAMVTGIINILEQIPIFFVNSLRWMAKGAVQIVFSIAQTFVFVVDIILTAISKLAQMLVNAIKFIVKAYINGWFGILKGFIFVIDKILEGIGSLIKKAAGAFGWIPGLGGKIKNAAASMSDSLGGAMDVWAERAQRAQNGVLDVVDSIGGGVNNLIGRLEGVGNGLGNMLQSTQNFLMSGIDDVANWLTGKIGSASNFAAAGRNAINKFIDGMVEGGLIPAGLGKKVTDDLGDALYKDPAAAKAVGQAIANAVKEGMSSLQDSYFDAVIGNLGDAMSKIREELSEILTKQKEDALKAYDDQIAGIEALAEAEERLTATEEYESNRRQRIKDRELQRDNYQKERALAIYEGRVDEARNLDLSELKNAEDFSKEISDLDRSRQRELQGQNRQDAISIIQKNKEEASKLFDEAIKEFEDYVEEITRNGTISEAQLSEQFAKIAAKANTTSSGINTAFQTSFSALPNLIRTGLDPSTSESGFFSTELGKLVDVAKTRFGLSTGTGADAGSILGVTTEMLTSTSTGIPARITSAFAGGGAIQTAYGSAMTQLTTYIANKNNPESPDSLAGVFKKAIADANSAMEQEILKNQRGIGSAFAAIVATINEKVKGLTIAEAVKKGMEEAKKAAADGAKDIGDAISGGGSGSSGGADKIWARLKTGRANSWKDITYASPANRAILNDSRYKIHYGGSTAPNYFKGGRMPYGNGGPTFGPMNQGIPATLHGGEFVLRKSAVDQYGLDMLNQINKGIYVPKVPKFNMPMSNYAKISGVSGSPQASTSETTHNYNFYVDNFIGETEWFNSMMKEYNMKVVPANQKQAGLENRVIRTYNGLNRGM